MQLPHIIQMPPVGSAHHIAGLTQAATPLLFNQKSCTLAGPILWLVPTEKQAAQLAQQIRFWRKALKPLGTTLPRCYRYQFVAPELADQLAFRRQHLRNMVMLTKLIQHQPGFYVFAAPLLDRRLPTYASLKEVIRILKSGETESPTSLAEHLVTVGYQNEKRALVKGSFARRGGIVEVFPPQHKNPLRIEFNETAIQKITSFNPETGETLKQFTTLELPPLKVKRRGDSILNFWQTPKDSLFILDSPGEIKEQLKQPDLRRSDLYTSLKAQITPLARLYIHPFPPLKIAESDIYQFDFITPPIYRGNFQALQADLKKWKENKYTIIIASVKAEDLQKEFKRRRLATALHITKINEDQRAALGGFLSKRNKLVVLTDKEIYGIAAFRPTPTKRSAAHRAFLSGLKVDDYVVHIDHGIGRFIGMQRNLLDGVMREYFAVEYADHDRLFVPVEIADKLSKYVGGNEQPALHRLSGTEWKLIRSRIQQDARALAQELLSLYAQRELATGYAHPADGDISQQVADTFAYEETPDQTRALIEIRQDMESPKPMDRLLVGDVGFGKTEVALRAAVKCVEGGKQVAILAPTTILAEQHTKTFEKRLKNTGMRIATLSRFQTTSQQNKTVAAIKAGTVDIVIGTHRLLSSDISFKTLGLIVIDEEQRFGVRAKERLKHLRVNVDVLSMTATPIPRTLNLALAQVRDISTIETPPPGRLPIETIVAREDTAEIRKAILRELKRKGQVYILHNHVATIEAMRRKIEKLVPQARVGVAHGQLSEDKLSQSMQDFSDYRTDVLIASTIIENGLDIPRVNTLIVLRSTHFGLSQLYQLRGRIGRGSERAYAYFFYNNQELKGRARERLTALLEATQLGGGFQVAMRDLEIRGAGNILGVEQSGTIQAVGLNLFLRLLRQAVAEIKGGIAGPRLDVKVELPLESYLPEDYIGVEEDRLLAYQRLADTRSLAELQDESDDLIQTYGAPPTQARNYLTLLRLRLLAELALVIKIETRMMRSRGGKEQKRLVLEGATDFPVDLVTAIITKNANWKLKGRALNIPFDVHAEEWIIELERVLNILSAPQIASLKTNGDALKTNNPFFKNT